MIWRTDKPTEKVIVAKLTEGFCHQKDSYAILRLANEPYQHYSEDGEEIPYSAIEKWASLEEETISNAEFAERAKKWILDNLFFFCYGDKDEVLETMKKELGR